MVDPVTLTGLALAGSAGFFGSQMMGGSKGGATPPAPAAPDAPPQPGKAPAPKTAAPSQQPSFLGAAAVPQPGGSGSKSLLGQ